LRTSGRLRLTPAAKAVFTGIRDARKNREAGLGTVLNACWTCPARTRRLFVPAGS
jgi:hypothetical protein